MPVIEPTRLRGTTGAAVRGTGWTCTGPFWATTVGLAAGTATYCGGAA
jgi:cytochrome c biogenesis protein CcdA